MSILLFFALWFVISIGVGLALGYFIETGKGPRDS
jgi:uncharacterized protein YneF (UPF0154 family)